MPPGLALDRVALTSLAYRHACGTPRCPRVTCFPARWAVVPEGGRKTQTGLAKSVQPGLDAVIWALAGDRHGVLALAEICALGITSAGVRHRAASGRLDRRYRGCLLACPAAAPQPQGALDGRGAGVGPGRQVLSHVQAAALHGLRQTDARAIPRDRPSPLAAQSRGDQGPPLDNTHRGRRHGGRRDPVHHRCSHPVRYCRDDRPPSAGAGVRPVGDPRAVRPGSDRGSTEAESDPAWRPAGQIDPRGALRRLDAHGVRARRGVLRALPADRDPPAPGSAVARAPGWRARHPGRLPLARAASGGRGRRREVPRDEAGTPARRPQGSASHRPRVAPDPYQRPSDLLPARRARGDPDGARQAAATGAGKRASRRARLTSR